MQDNTRKITNHNLKDVEFLSLGQNCASASNFVNSKLMKNKKGGRKSGVFDLMVTSYYGLCNLIEDGFSHFFDNIEIIDNIENKKYKHNCLFYSNAAKAKYNDKLIVNKKYGLFFNHESEGHPFLSKQEKWERPDFFTMNNLREFKNRYQKRIVSFLDTIEYCIQQQKTLIFILNTYTTPIKLNNIIKNKYPNLKYKILCNKMDTITTNNIYDFCMHCFNIKTNKYNIDMDEKPYDKNFVNENIIMDGWNMINKIEVLLI